MPRELKSLRRAIYDLNVRDFTYVVANMRQEDFEEISALMPENIKRGEYGSLLTKAAFEGPGYTAWINDEPVAAFGAGMSDSYSTAIAWAFGTPRFKRVASVISHFYMTKLSHDLYNAGVTRLEARALGTHVYARNWLKSLGFHEDCELPYYGRNGQSFYLYSLTLADYNKMFKERLN